MKSDRRNFLRNSCGVCSCLGASLLLSGSAGADETANNDEAAKNEAALKKQIEQTTGFARAWTSSLVQIMDKELDPKAVVTVLEACGRACADRNSAELITTFANNVDGLLAKMKDLWLDSFEHDTDKKSIRLIGRELNACFCPIHPEGNTHSYCECSNGHMQQLFGEVIGKPVKVTLTESVLRGGQRCSWDISYQQA